MGGSLSQKPCPEDEEVRLPVELQASQYKQRVTRLVEEAQKSPPSESLDVTLRRCIAFCYSVTTEWAPFVRVTVFADNSAEHQLNVPVHSTLLTCLGEPGFETEEVPCKAVPGTDVQFGHVRPSLFWTRRVACRVPLRSLAHIYLKWFADLEDTDERKQLLVNILLQMHEACYNCVGRHKEVFEYCIYDLMQAEEPVPICRGGTHSAQAVCQHAAAFLDRHKRNALHAAFLSPLKFLFQRRYEVFENLDSHGASFWVAILRSFNSDLDMPFENIEESLTWAGFGALWISYRTCSRAPLARPCIGSRSRRIWAWTGGCSPRTCPSLRPCRAGSGACRRGRGPMASRRGVEAGPAASPQRRVPELREALCQLLRPRGAAPVLGPFRRELCALGRGAGPGLGGARRKAAAGAASGALLHGRGGQPERRFKASSGSLGALGVCLNGPRDNPISGC
ncbi:unnamed protein product [Effrenium voratum]|nr:unnamed protein product [Effrenium voratum]